MLLLHKLLLLVHDLMLLVHKLLLLEHKLLLLEHKMLLLEHKLLLHATHITLIIIQLVDDQLSIASFILGSSSLAQFSLGLALLSPSLLVEAKTQLLGFRLDYRLVWLGYSYFSRCQVEGGCLGKLKKRALALVKGLEIIYVSSLK